MSEYVTVRMTLPKRLFHRATALAQEQNRQIDALVAEVLEKAIPAVYVSPDRPRMEQEQAAYEQLRPFLVERHEGQYVAIHGGKLVDADIDQLALARRILANYPGQVVHIRLVRREPEPDLKFRSPRFLD